MLSLLSSSSSTTTLLHSFIYWSRVTFFKTHTVQSTYELVNEKEKYKNIADEMDQTFAELAGY